MISFNREAVSRTAQQLGQALHTTLLAAGWTLEYANALAITGGTAASPGWGDPASVINASFGKVVYKMPASAFATRWLVEFDLFRTSAAVTVELRIRTAKAVDAVTGTLTDAGTQLGFESTANVSTILGESIISASENGVLVSMGLDDGYGWILCAERKRTLIGEYLNDIVIHAISPLSTSANGRPAGGAIARNAASGESGLAAYVMIGLMNNTAISQASSLSAPGGLRGIAAGPLIASGGLVGMSGHLLFFPSGDVAAGNDQLVAVGATEQLFFCASTASAFGGQIGTYRPAFLKA